MQTLPSTVSHELVETFAAGFAAADPVIAEMDARAERTGFPTVGPAVGSWLRFLAGAIDADRAFEFGSGFGYSAYWLAEAVSPDGEIVCCEYDAENVADAATYLERGGYRDRVTLVEGDALAAIERRSGPFDLVLIDHEKERYPEAFERVREKVAPGGLLCADNAMTSGNIDFPTLAALVSDGEAAPDAEDADGDETGATATPEGPPDETDDGPTAGTRGVATYLRTVRDDPAFETVMLPLGEGLAVSRRRPGAD